jgi:hypothetical protein
MGAILWGFSYARKRGKKCQENLSVHVLILTVQNLQMGASVRNMPNRKLPDTRSITETLLYAVGMDEHGNLSATDTSKPTRYVRSD